MLVPSKIPWNINSFIHFSVCVQAHYFTSKQKLKWRWFNRVVLLFPGCRFLIDWLCVQESSDWSSFYNTGAIVGCLFLVQFSGYTWCFSVPPHCTHLTLTDLKWTLWSHTSYAPLFVLCTIFLVKENLTLQNIRATVWGDNGSGSKMGHLPISSQWTDPLLL